jgi:hypothetical protein
MLLIIIAVSVLVVWAYVLFLRPFLIAKYPTTFGKFAAVEGALWDQSRSILIARGYSLAGILVGLQGLASAAGVDVTPFITELGKAIPEGYRTLAISGFLILTGIGFEWLRRVTTKPLGV